MPGGAKGVGEARRRRFGEGGAEANACGGRGLEPFLERVYCMRI